MRTARDGRVRRLTLILGLVILVAAAALVWTQRLTPSAEADGNQRFDDLVIELDQQLRAKHGDVCGEIISLLPDGEAKPHGLASGAEVPLAAVAVLNEKSRTSLDAFEGRSVNVSDISLVSRDSTSEVLSGGREVLGKAIKATYLTGGARGVDRWQVTDIAHFYACPAGA